MIKLPKWEYKVVPLPRFKVGEDPKIVSKAFQDLLNKLGAENWELVSITIEPYPPHESYAYFKRAHAD